jgi:hypothetical protein
VDAEAKEFHLRMEKELSDGHANPVDYAENSKEDAHPGGPSLKALNAAAHQVHTVTVSFTSITARRSSQERLDEMRKAHEEMLASETALMETNVSPPPCVRIPKSHITRPQSKADAVEYMKELDTDKDGVLVPPSPRS